MRFHSLRSGEAVERVPSLPEGCQQLCCLCGQWSSHLLQGSHTGLEVGGGDTVEVLELRESGTIVSLERGGGGWEGKEERMGRERVGE